MENRISATMSQEDYDAVMASIQTIKNRLPFLLSLSSRERRELAKLGDKSKSFVDKAVEAARQYPDLLPRGLDVSEMERDVALFDQLYGIHVAVSDLAEKVESTYFTAGADAYAAGLVVYQAVKYNGKGTELEAVADALAQRFVRKSSAPAATTPESTPSAG